MAEELTIVTAVPVVTLTKQGKFTKYYVKVQADDQAKGLSIHYEADVDASGVPTVQDKLLVAVLAGVHPEWLHPDTNQPVEGGEVPITFQAVSASECGGDDPVRARRHDTLHLSTVDNGLLTRLDVSMRDESGHTVHAHAVLSKGQVTSMLAALLAIYQRLCEE